MYNTKQTKGTLQTPCVRATYYNIGKKDKITSHHHQEPRPFLARVGVLELAVSRGPLSRAKGSVCNRAHTHTHIQYTQAETKKKKKKEKDEEELVTPCRKNVYTLRAGIYTFVRLNEREGGVVGSKKKGGGFSD